MEPTVLYRADGRRKKPTSPQIVGIIMEDSLRPRRNAAWTTVYNTSRRPDSIPGYHLTDASYMGSAGHAVDYKPRHAGAVRHWCKDQGCYAADCGGSLKDYLEGSSMHGLRYVGESNLHWAERTFWAVAFVLAMLLAAYFITNLYNKWDNDPVIVSLSPRSTSLIKIPFPAITVCNMNRAKKSRADDIDRTTNDQQRELETLLLNDLCDHPNNITIQYEENKNHTGKWKTIENFMVKVAQPCHELIVSCKYAGFLENCVDIFNPTLTDEGICCTFNRVKRDYLYKNPRDLSDLNVTFPLPTVDWTPENGYPEDTPLGRVPRRPRGAGSHLGFTVVLDAQTDEYFCSSTVSVGFKMVLHSPVETPKISGFGVAMAPGLEYQMALRPRLTQSSKQLREIAVPKRQCVFADERQLRFYRTYTQRNCALECEANYTLVVCKCVLPYMPKDETTRICGRTDEVCAYEARHKMEIRLADQFTNETDDNSNTTDVNPKPKCECLPACSEINYVAQATSSPLLPLHLIAEKTFLKNITDSTYFQRNMAVVHLYFTETQFTSVEKGELFGFTEFLSSTGGLLGLFMGFSCLSLIEIIYHLSLRMLCTVVRGRKSETKTGRVPQTAEISPSPKENKILLQYTPTFSGKRKSTSVPKLPSDWF